jgi:Ca2+-binding RTX toxin-like protein
MANVQGTSGNDFIDLVDGVTNGADSISGYGGDDTLKGFGGNDQIFGGDGKDDLFGGLDDDRLVGGPGADKLVGGPGFDEAAYFNSPVGVTVSLLTGLGSGGEAEGDHLSGIEELSGSGHDDSLWGDNADNHLAGRGGADQIKGFGGDDWIWGDGGDDTLYGGDGDDVISGGSGTNTINGGAGSDHIWGSGGADTLVWSSTAEAPFVPISGPMGVDPNALDTIRNFSSAEGDVIDLSAIDADVYADGDQAFTFIGTAPLSGTPGEINYYDYCGLIFIQMQTGTSADVEGMIFLDWSDGTQTPEASWFVL